MAIPSRQASFMKKYFLIAFLTFVFSISYNDKSFAEPVTGEGAMRVDTMSHHVWRGMRLSDDGPVVQPSFDATFLEIGSANPFNLGVNIWANYDTELKEWTRSDYTLRADLTMSGIEVGFGYVYYNFKQFHDTQEAYISLGYDAFLRPMFKVYFDFDEGDGSYVEGSIDHSIEFTEETSFNFGVTMGIDLENELLGKDKDGDELIIFYSGHTYMSLSYKPHPNILIEPIISYDFPLTDEAERVIEAKSVNNDSEIFYGGVGLAMVF